MSDNIINLSAALNKVVKSMCNQFKISEPLKPTLKVVKLVQNTLNMSKCRVC